MKLATLDNGTRDGILFVVSTDLSVCADASKIAPTLQIALENWRECAPRLAELAHAVTSGKADTVRFDVTAARAPLPRAFQWLDGSVFRNHLLLMSKAFGIDPTLHANSSVPLMYQGGSDTLNSAAGDIVLPSEAEGIDFEGEFGVILDDVPMGVTAEAALDHIRLLTLINDVSLRNLLPREMASGFGPLHGKPSSAFAPVVVTPDEIGAAWSSGKICLPLNVWWNEAAFGSPNGGEMTFHFGELIAHAARTRHLLAGTIIGSGTVSNTDTEKVGSACIAERRALELIDKGQARTEYMKFGDRVRMEVYVDNKTVFGAIDQRVSQYRT